jgi:hypothetical protein
VRYSRECEVDSCLRVQAGRREDRDRAVLRTYQQFDLDAAEDDALGAGRDKGVDDVLYSARDSWRTTPRHSSS